VALSRFDFTPVTDERPRVDILIGDPKASIAKIAELVETSVHRHLGDSVSERLVAVGLDAAGADRARKHGHRGRSSSREGGIAAQAALTLLGDVPGLVGTGASGDRDVGVWTIGASCPPL
jgi:hypothetical protein